MKLVLTEQVVRCLISTCTFHDASTTMAILNMIDCDSVESLSSSVSVICRCQLSDVSTSTFNFNEKGKSDLKNIIMARSWGGG